MKVLPLTNFDPFLLLAQLERFVRNFLEVQHLGAPADGVARDQQLRTAVGHAAS